MFWRVLTIRAGKWPLFLRFYIKIKGFTNCFKCCRLSVVQIWPVWVLFSELDAVCGGAVTSVSEHPSQLTSFNGVSLKRSLGPQVWTGPVLPGSGLVVAAFLCFMKQDLNWVKTEFISALTLVFGHESYQLLDALIRHLLCCFSWCLNCSELQTHVWLL